MTHVMVRARANVQCRANVLAQCLHRACTWAARGCWCGYASSIAADGTAADGSEQRAPLTTCRAVHMKYKQKGPRQTARRRRLGKKTAGPRRRLGQRRVATSRLLMLRRRIPQVLCGKLAKALRVLHQCSVCQPACVNLLRVSTRCVVLWSARCLLWCVAYAHVIALAVRFCFCFCFCFCSCFCFCFCCALCCRPAARAGHLCALCALTCCLPCCLLHREYTGCSARG
jgi:hypothetical protein